MFSARSTRFMIRALLSLGLVVGAPLLLIAITVVLVVLAGMIQ